MPRNTLGTNLNLCFTKLKRPLPPQSANHNSNEHHTSLHFCNSITNFNSLYNLSLDCNSNIPTSSSSTNYSTTISEESDYIYELATTPDLATVYASQRFFFSSPGHSNSIIDSSSSSMSSSLTSTLSSVEPRESDALVVDGSIAIPTYSPDPYLDFRISMQEMVEARGLTDIRGNWDLLHELLMCYLTLNPKSTHKYIVDAFADLIVCLMTSKSSQHLDPCAGSTRPIKVTTLPTEFSPYPRSNPRPLVKSGAASSTAPQPMYKYFYQPDDPLHEVLWKWERPRLSSRW